jgi:hypothetical protein
MTWMQPIAAWWLDYFAGATILLFVVLVAGRVIHQPVQRMALAWSAIIGLLVLAVCCAAPTWPRVAPLANIRSMEIREKPASGMVTGDELLGRLKPEHLLSARPKRTVGVEVMVVEDGDTIKWIQFREPISSSQFVT